MFNSPIETTRNVAKVAQENYRTIRDNPQLLGEDISRVMARKAFEGIENIGEMVITECSAMGEHACQAKVDWKQTKGNPYEPFLWKKYHIGDDEFDLVAYRRPRRHLFMKLLCCMS